MSKIITPDKRIQPVNENKILQQYDDRMRDAILMTALMTLSISIHKHLANEEGHVNTHDLRVRIRECVQHIKEDGSKCGEILGLLLCYCAEEEINMGGDLLKWHKDLTEASSGSTDKQD